jgi:hypothetical protein
LKYPLFGTILRKERDKKGKKPREEVIATRSTNRTRGEWKRGREESTVRD